MEYFHEVSDLIEKGFLTLGRSGSDEFSEKKSRFIGFVRRVESVADFDGFLEEVKSQYSDATHHVWAYRIIEGGRLRELYSDDGEPSQSSGPPALKALAGRDLINIAAITVRYYGGTKLGVGGLIRAYSHSVVMALENAQIIRKIPADRWKILIDYSQLGIVEKFLEKYRGEITYREFSDIVSLNITLAARFRAEFERFMNDLTRGKGEFSIEGEEYVIWN